MPKISELSIAQSLDISNDDLLVIVDSETSTTRKIAIKDFAKVIAQILNITVDNDAGSNNPAPKPQPVEQVCGQTITRLNPDPLHIDAYTVSANEISLTFAYNTYNIGNRFTVIAESTSFVDATETYREVLFDTNDEVVANTSVTLCKPKGATKIVVYVKSGSSSSHSYTLTCTNNACSVSTTPIALTPTPTATPQVTPTVTPTLRDSGYIEATPTATPTSSPTPSITPSITPSTTPTISITPSTTPTISVTPSTTPTISVTPTISLTPSQTPPPPPPPPPPPTP